jgi:hypothetical protein
MVATKGFVTFFLNISENNKTIGMENYVELVRKHNQGSIDALAKDGYVCILLPCANEACRVEKINLVEEDEEDEEDEEKCEKTKEIK